MKLRERMGFLFAVAAFAARAGVYTVPAGGTVTVTDANVAEFADGIAFADAAGRAIFQTSSAPTMQVSGEAGAVVKDTAADWDMVTAQTSFKGTWDFTAGTTTLSAAGVLGPESTLAKSNIYVRAGATLAYNHINVVFGYRPLHLAGSGVDGAGALHMIKRSDSTSCLRHLVLDDDASICMDKDAYLFFGTDYSKREVELNGHELTIQSPNVWFYQIAASYVVGPGRIRLVNPKINNSYSGWSLRGGYLLDPSVEVLLEDMTAPMMYNHSPSNFYAKMTVAENAKAVFAHQHQFDTVLDETGNKVSGTGFARDDGTQNFWAGPVELREGSLLQLGSTMRSADTAAGHNLRYIVGISGYISGTGNLNLGTHVSYDGGRIVISGPTNTFTGNTTIKTQTGRSEVMLAYSNSVPAYANVTVSGGELKLPITADDSTWPASCWARFLALATFSDQGGIGLDNTALADWAISGADIDAGFAPADGRALEPIPLGSGKVTMTLPMESPVTPFVPDPAAEFVFSGLGQVNAVNGRLHAYHPTKGTIVYADGADFKPVAYPWYVAKSYGCPEVVFRGGTYTNVAPLPADETHFASDELSALRVGAYRSQGVLRVVDDSVITGKIQVAYYSTSTGAVYQAGGRVALLGNNDDNRASRCSHVAYGGHGYYELAGGELDIVGFFTLVGGSGSSVFHQKGGALRVVPNPGKESSLPFFNLETANNTRSHVRFSGGTSEFIYILAGRYDGGTDVQLTIDGDAALSTSKGLNSGYSSVPVKFNFNGGAYKGALPLRFRVGEGFTKGWYARTYLNFNGGTWKTGNGAILGKPMPETDEERATSTASQPIAKTTIYAKGATFDASGLWPSLDMPLTAPGGKGLGTIPWTPRAGFIAPPAVVITGDGSNACAMAEFDSDSGTVTGFTITCPGEGYTTATAQLYMGDLVVETIDCTGALVDNVGGGVTLRNSLGSGYFALNATNTYMGETVIDMGDTYVTVNVAGAIPAGNDLTLKSGILQMNNKQELEVGALTLAGGSITSLNAPIRAKTLVAVQAETASALSTGVILTETDQTISVDDLLAGKSWKVAKALTLAADTVLTVTGDFSKLDRKTRYTIATAETLAGVPALVTEDTSDAAQGWQLITRDNSILLSFPQGTAIFLR